MRLTIGRCVGAMSGHRIVPLAALVVLAMLGTAKPGSADSLVSFPKKVNFTTSAGGMAGSGNLTYASDRRSLTLSNLQGGGLVADQAMESVFDGKDLALEQGTIYNVRVTDPDKRMVQRMARQVGGMLDDKAFVYNFTRYSDSGVTTTEPHTEYKVADFLTMFILSADYVSRGRQDKMDVSLLFDRSVKHVVLSRVGDAKVSFSGGGKVDAVELSLAFPDDPGNGFRYYIANEGNVYYPAKFIATGKQPLELYGEIMAK